MALFGRLAPPLALMALIFWLSDQPDLNSGLGTIDLVGRKIVHVGIYGVLFALWWRALGWRSAAVAASIAVAYAISDEWHQSHVDGRNGSPVDVLLDSAGVALAWVALRAWRTQGAGAGGSH